MDTQNQGGNFYKIIAYFLFAQSIYTLYIFISSVLINYDPDLFTEIGYWTILYASTFITGLILAITGIGILLNKSWGIILYWVFIILSILTPWFRIPINGDYTFGYRFSYILLVLNAILAMYVTIFYWKKW